MAFDFEGLKKPKTVSTEEDLSYRLPSGFKPDKPEAKKDNSLSLDLPDALQTYVDTSLTPAKAFLGIGEAVADTAKQTNAYKKYMYSDEEKLAEAKKISIETGIAENVLIASDDNLAKGREMFNFRRKQMALAPQGMNDFDIQQIYDAYPALGELKDDTEMAIGFSHIENIKQTKGIVGAAQTGLETAKLMRDRENVAMKGFMGETLTDDDWKKLDELAEKLQQAKSFPDFGDSPLANIIGNTAQQVYRYAPSTGKGVVAGAALAPIGAIAGGAGGSVAGGVGAVPGAIAGAKYAFGLGFKWATMADMFAHMGADKYVEYLRLRDKQGNRLLSDADARLFAMVEAGAETGIEFWNYNSIMNMLGGSIHRKAIKDIVANAASNNEAVKAGILNYAKGVAKVSGQVFAEELPEEAVQDIAEKGMWNFITGTYATNNNYKQYSGKEMIDSAGNAMLEAAPSAAGFSIMAGAGSTVSGVRSFARMAAIRKTYTDNEIQVANGVDMVSQLQENKAENDLYKKQPDIYEKVLHNELDGTVYAQTRIDTELALADEETAKVFYQLAQEAGYEQEDINAIVENGADLVLPTELYTSKVDSGSKMNTFIKFGEGTESIARQKQMKELYQRELEGFMDKEEGKQAELIDTLIATAFPNSGPEQDLGAEIILSYPSDPANGWKAERNSAQNNIDNRLEPIYSRLREGMKQGVRLVEYGENGQKMRVSKNDQWYSDFYKEHKRPPNKQELQDIAIDIYNGNGAKYGFTDWEANTAELADAFKSNADELQTELDRVNLLDSIKDNLLNLSRAELGVMKGLSKEAVKVYQTVSKLADTATSKKAKQSVKTTAILLARHADRIAEIARQSGMKDFTAEDYFSRMKFDFSGQGESLFKGGETVNQAGKLEKIAIDADGNEIETLNGTPIMMDENGYITMYHRTSVENAKEIEENGFKKGKENTGEVFLSTKSDGQIIGYGDTVVTVKVPANKVRIDDAFNDEVHAAVSHKYLKVVKPFDITKTPAFIKWFKNSKVVDENGKPLIVYHGGTVEDVFDTNRGKGETQYGSGAYFANGEGIAEQWVSYRGKGKVAAYYLSITNPFDDTLREVSQAKERAKLTELLKQEGASDSQIEFMLGDHGKYGDTTFSKIADFFKGKSNKKGFWIGADEANVLLRKAGYDGIIGNLQDSEQYIAFSPTQIKSVDNTGAFDENNANIYYQAGSNQIADNIVKNSEGKPLILYRGTADGKYSGVGVAWLGQGIYYSDKENVAKNYGDKIEKSHLIMKNPATITDDTRETFKRLGLMELKPKRWDITYGEAIKAQEEIESKINENEIEVEEARKGFYDVGVNYEGKYYNVHNITSLQLKYNGKDFLKDLLVRRVLYEKIGISQTNIPLRDFSANEISTTLQKNGYDGIIANGTDVLSGGSKEYVVFNRNQIIPASNNIYYQSAFHGSPYIFDKFTLEHIGKGEGAQAHGHGLYFSLAKQVAKKYRNALLNKTPKGFANISYNGKTAGQWYVEFKDKTDKLSVEKTSLLRTLAKSYDFDEALKEAKENKYSKEAVSWYKETFKDFKKPGAVYEVDIPEDDVMLFEDKKFSEQPPQVREALNKVKSVWQTSPGGYFSDNLTGREIYQTIQNDLKDGTLKAPKGIKNAGSPESASLFLNELGIEGIRYNGNMDGECAVVFNDEAIQILNTYYQQNQDIHGSTTFLQSGERIIRLFETADQSTLAHELGHNFLADILYWGKLETAPAWLKQDYDTVCKYINYDGVSELTTEQHEKFARGFEAYLRNGEAPIKGLRGVFRKFKKWLTGLYKDFIDLGGLPSAEVRAVMDRMLVSEQEVEDEAKLQQYENGLKEIGKIVSTSDAQMYARWQNEAKEEAKEKTLAVAMKEVTDSLPKQRTDEISQYEKDIREQLSEQDVFRVEAILKNNNDLTLLPALGYTEESYKEALAKAGGGLEQAVQKAVADFTKDYDSAPMSKETIREQAEKAIRDGDYNDMLVGFELEAMRAKVEEGNIANDKAVKKIEEIIAAMNGEEVSKETDEPAKVKSLKQKIADLRYSFRWTQAEERLIQENKLAELKKQIKDKKTQVRVLKSRVQASVTWTKDIAQDRLKRLRLSEVMSTRMWINLAKKSSQDALAAIKKEKWNDALKYKQQQLIYTIMASESTKIKDKVNKIVARQQKRSANMVQGKTKMPVNERYYFNHLLYVFGINKRDALEPVDGVESFLSLVKRFADNYEANFTDEDGNVGLPNWVLTAIGGREVYGSRTENPLYADVKSQKKPAMGYEALKLQDFLAINDLLSTIYTVGRNADKLRTIKTADGKVISLKDVVDDLVLSITANVAVESNKDLTGATKKGKIESALEKGNDILLDLVKMETIFDQIDGGRENGAAMTYFYNVASEARNHEKRMQIEATNKMKELFKPYSALELRRMRQDQKYAFGTSILTKEQVIVLALNSGTELNKKRILDGYKVSEEGLMETLSNLEEKDLTLIHGIWRLFNSYWEETVGVEERMNGVGLVKQEALPFTINGKDGNVYKVTGGYYPIKYDPTKSVKAAEQQEDDIAKQLHNDNAIFGTRIGFTKERNKTAKITRPVLLTFDVIPTALDNVIHNISHREMVRDINRIVTNKDFQDSVVNHFGINTYRAMKQWVRDNWAQEKKFSRLDKVASYLRRNMTGAVLGWRTTTALLNILNIFPMSEYLGVMGASKAVKDFYTNPMQNRAFITSKSVFIADRVNTMDRDMREVAKSLEGKANPVIRFAKNESFRLIAETDLMLAMPLWLAEYKRVFQEGVASKADVETIERNAVAAGDKAVRRIFGSGEIHDLAPVQKGNELEKMLTMFYSYFNVVYNALSRKNRTGSRYDLARSFLYWIVLTSIGESLIRGAVNGDDEDKLLKRMGKNLVSQSLGMVPVARDVFVGTLDLMFNDKSYGGAKVSSIYDGFTRFTTAAKTGYKLANDEGNKDWLDLMQESVKASNAFTGVSDTATDALFTTMRYIETDFDAEIGEYLKAVVFDKKLEK